MGLHFYPCPKPTTTLSICTLFTCLQQRALSTYLSMLGRHCQLILNPESAKKKCRLLKSSAANNCLTLLTNQA